ncbi:MAG: methionine synthase, partial [Rhizobacter sp.]|nr:methionine synthase [Chlorobiales bacterium]
GMKIPLLIGGATTSKIHTAVKIAPNYSAPTVHVLDASRSVPVVNSLTTADLKDAFAEKIVAEYETVRGEHYRKRTTQKYATLAEARRNPVDIAWKPEELYTPKQLGITVFENVPLETLRSYIDWTPFFQTWQLAGRYPKILDDATVGVEARKLLADANALLDKLIADKSLTATGVAGLFPANAVGDDIEVYTDETRSDVRAVIHTLRQQTDKAAGRFNRALSDYIAPKSNGSEGGLKDYIGGFAVTTGLGADDVAKRFEAEHDDYQSIMTKALADRLAEAFAEWLHEKVRTELWGYAPAEKLANDSLIEETYQGIRPAPGYPACPDHTEKSILFDLLGAERHTGITLTESYAMFPAASVSGFYFAHPRAEYFGLGKISKDQVADYAARKGLTLEETERWLSPNLGYEPAAKEIASVPATA